MKNYNILGNFKATHTIKPTQSQVCMVLFVNVSLLIQRRKKPIIICKLFPLVNVPLCKYYNMLVTVNTNDS